MRFLADESYDFAVVTALRGAGHDVTAVVETNASADDEVVLSLARADVRTLLTEDKAGARTTLARAVVDGVTAFGERIQGAFVVLEPGRARISRPAAAE